MTDLERIEEIEKIIGFKLERVEPDKFEFGSDDCSRRYCVDEDDNVISFCSKLTIFRGNFS